MTPEGKVKRKVVNLLKKHSAYYFFPATHGYGRSGVPDIVACVSGSFFGIECKAGKNKPTPLQNKNLADIENANGIAVIVNEDSLDNLEGLLSWADEQ